LFLLQQAQIMDCGLRDLLGPRFFNCCSIYFRSEGFCII